MSFLQRILEDPARLKRLKVLFYATLVLLAAAEVVLPIVLHDEAHHHFAFEGWPAFGSAYGFVSCVLTTLSWSWSTSWYSDRSCNVVSPMIGSVRLTGGVATSPLPSPLPPP